MKESTTFNFLFEQPNPQGPGFQTYQFSITSRTREDALKKLMVDLRNVANECEENLSEEHKA
jgi:hypothetical protein